MALLERINSPADLRALNYDQLNLLSEEIRGFIVESVSRTGGHLGSNLGAVELTLAIHRKFDSPRDRILWDTGHQSYVHKIVTGRKSRFGELRQEDGLSGYPNRAESEHDWIENSHASTVLSYAHGLGQANQANGSDSRIVAVIGDGALTGGMAFEALNNLGCSNTPCVIVLNDNGRSYAPTISQLTANLVKLRMSPKYLAAKQRVEKTLSGIPGVGDRVVQGVKSMKAAVREYVDPPVFFEALGIRYIGPFDGHNIPLIEEALDSARDWDGPVVVHLLTHKGLGYLPAEDDDEKHLHDAPIFDVTTGPDKWAPVGYTEAFSNAVSQAGSEDSRVVAITAAMPGPTGLLQFEKRFPSRFIDVGIAEQHAATMAAGLAMGGMRPVVAIYSTFFARCFDQAAYDVGLHQLPVVFALDRAGITGDDGASHNGVLDMSLGLNIPGMTIFAPSSAQDLDQMLRTALQLDGPSMIRYPKGAARQVTIEQLGLGMKALKLIEGQDVCILAVGKMVEAAEQAAARLSEHGISATVWDVRMIRPLDIEMLGNALNHQLVVTVEDGIEVGGAGSAIMHALAALSPTHQIPPMITMGVPAQFISQAKPAAIHARLGLDAAGIDQRIQASLAHIQA